LEYDKKCLFLNLTGDLTSRHINVLKLMNDPREYLKAKGITLSMSMGGIEHMFSRALKDYDDEKDFYQNIYEDLQNRHLLTKGGWGATMSLDGILTARTTSFGKQYLSYLQSPL